MYSAATDAPAFVARRKIAAHAREQHGVVSAQPACRAPLCATFETSSPLIPLLKPGGASPLRLFAGTGIA
jgi:hypothetical protein